MTYSDICESVHMLKKKYDETDPFKLCKAMGIILLLQPMGKHEGAIKGFYMKCKRIRTITVNGDLPEIIQKIIVAHELGHATIHAGSGVHAFHDIALFDQATEMEREANLFAAEYMLEDEEVLDALNQDTTFFSAAAMLRVPMEMLDFKFRMMKWKGYKLIEPPIHARGDFMRNMEVPDDADYYS